jgi:hypothetical protein
MVILTCRTLHFSRVQSTATMVTRPETTSSSHRRPRKRAAPAFLTFGQCCTAKSIACDNVRGEHRPPYQRVLLAHFLRSHSQ